MDRDATSDAGQAAAPVPPGAAAAPGARAFVEAVEARVTALRGRGYALSGVEAHAVLAWWQQGYSLAVVLATVERVSARARRRGAASFGLDTVTRHLAQGVAGGPGGPLDVGPQAGDARPAQEAEGHVAESRLRGRLRALVEGVGVRLPEGAAREAMRRAWASVGRAEQGGEDPWALAARLDAEVLEALGAVTPPDVLGDAEAAARTTDAWRTSSPRARLEAEALARARAVRSYFGVPELLEALLHP
jgi:hypothetical protein